MAALNRPFTGRGFIAGNGNRVNYSFCAVGTGPSDANPLIIEHGSISATESSSITTIGTTAYNGFTDSYSGPTTISGTVDGFVTASDTDHTNDPVSVRAGTKMYLIITAGSWTYEGYVLVSNFNISVNSSEMASVQFGYTFKTVPTKRTLGFYRGGACNKP
jgi:hypothetical protein